MRGVSVPELTPTTASITLVIGGAMWGLFWIPVRFFLDYGLSGAWPGIVMYTATILVLLPFYWPQRRSLVSNWRALVLSGAFTGAAFSLFTTSLGYTDVARAILLFYLTPIWGTVLGLIFLGERLNANRIFAVLLGVGGLFVVLGGGAGLPWPQNSGDWLALISGMTWAVGTLGLYKASGVTASGQVFAFVIGALFVSILSLGPLYLSGEADPNPATLLAVSPFAVLSVIYVIPMMFLTVWPATFLPPARVGLLLMSEVVVGLLTAAAFAGEHFGLREAIGAVLIVGAAVVEVVRTNEPGPAKP